jgi:hypothetical protein
MRSIPGLGRAISALMRSYALTTANAQFRTRQCFGAIAAWNAGVTTGRRRDIDSVQPLPALLRLRGRYRLRWRRYIAPHEPSHQRPPLLLLPASLRLPSLPVRRLVLEHPAADRDQIRNHAIIRRPGLLQLPTAPPTTHRPRSQTQRPGNPPHRLTSRQTTLRLRPHLRIDRRLRAAATTSHHKLLSTVRR